MVDVKVQKAYNYAYGALLTSSRLLPWALKAPPQSAGNYDPAGNAQWSTKFQEYLDTAADQFHRIYRLEGGKPLEVASTLIKESSKLWRAGAGYQPGSPEYVKMIQTILEKLKSARAELDARCQIRYRIWILNPWRYFPTKLD